MSTIGHRLPSPLFERLTTGIQGARKIRTCSDCGYQWPTTEIALVNSWIGERSDCCPVHKTTLGFAASHIGVESTKSGHFWSAGLMKVIGWGGYYRRRVCRVQVGVNADKTPKKCLARWTTGEFCSDGIIVADIQACPRCGGVRSKTNQPTKKPKPV